MAKLIEMPFWDMDLWDPRNHVLLGPRTPQGKGPFTGTCNTGTLSANGRIQSSCLLDAANSIPHGCHAMAMQAYNMAGTTCFNPCENEGNKNVDKKEKLYTLVLHAHVHLKTLTYLLCDHIHSCKHKNGRLSVRHSACPVFILTLM